VVPPCLWLFLVLRLITTHFGFISTVSFRRTRRTQLVWRETKLNALSNYEEIIACYYGIVNLINMFVISLSRRLPFGKEGDPVYHCIFKNK